VLEDLLMLPKAVLFDMDGTLTEPMLDFPAIKAEMGIGERPILEALAEMDAAARAVAETVLLRHEEHAAENSRLNPGCVELLAWLRHRRIATGLITRNSRVSTRTVLERHGLWFDALVTREDGPFKPDPRPLIVACEKLSVRANEAWMIGDGRYDVEAGAAASIPTIWISHGRSRPFEARPWREVRDLRELHELFHMIAER
jgi:HAD superfamily hydrolase (TIGR01549 family)